ncbi:hypothetical protein PHJA_000232500 [Phtheirospermum japonicum]|uniref:Uncharacterized protein n=1 Tax=Phtheirospermum japonicum TaxID=374723 RepID=A0A830B5E0_9LAMI|nr:hypothetical protein PHJA_000232500 [Phtheirospermum japonicum]
MQVMKYWVPSVLALATLKYQGKAESLFVENPIPVWCFLAATCVYWLTVGAMKQMPPRIGVKCKCYKNIVLSYAALTFGVLSAISLLSIFLPRQIALLLLVIWISLPIVLAWPILKYAFKLVGPKISNGIEKTSTKMGWVRGCKEESTLPV